MYLYIPWMSVTVLWYPWLSTTLWYLHTLPTESRTPRCGVVTGGTQQPCISIYHGYHQLCYDIHDLVQDCGISILSLQTPEPPGVMCGDWGHTTTMYLYIPWISSTVLWHPWLSTTLWYLHTLPTESRTPRCGVVTGGTHQPCISIYHGCQ